MSRRIAVAIWLEKISSVTAVCFLLSFALLGCLGECRGAAWEFWQPWSNGPPLAIQRKHNPPAPTLPPPWGLAETLSWRRMRSRAKMSPRREVRTLKACAKRYAVFLLAWDFLWKWLTAWTSLSKNTRFSSETTTQNRPHDSHIKAKPTYARHMFGE